MIHMPGHIYYRVGQYDRARDSFLASKKFEEDYMREEQLTPVDAWNYPHNLSYLIASDVESGRVKEAMEMAKLLDSLPANPMIGKGVPMHVMTVGGAAVRLRLRVGDYKGAIDHPIALGFDEADAGQSAAAFRDALIDYASGMNSLHVLKDPIGGLKSAEVDSDAMDAIAWRLNKEKGDDKVDNPKGALTILEIYSLDLRGNLRAQQGRYDEAIDLLKRAVEQEEILGYSEPPRYARPGAGSAGPRLYRREEIR